MFTVAAPAYVDTFRVTWAAGIGGGYWFGYFSAIALIVLLLGAENALLSTFPSIAAVVLMLYRMPMCHTIPMNCLPMSFITHC